MFRLLFLISIALFAVFYDQFAFYDQFTITVNDFPLHIILHPFTLSVALIVSFLFVKDLFEKGTRLSSVHRCVNSHLNSMAKKRVDEAWEGFSDELKISLNNRRRLNDGEERFFAKKRVASYAILFSQLYQEGRLKIDSVHQVKQARSKVMYMIRLRSRSSKNLRMTIWISKIPLKQDEWSIEEVCIHPKSGNIHQGETLTGARMRRPKKIRLNMSPAHVQSSSLPSTAQS